MLVAKTKNIPGFNSNFEVHEVVLADNSRDAGKFKNVGTMNALFLSQMTDNVVPNALGNITKNCK